MAKKKRIYELAKEYGMTGQELAKKLRDLGFAQVKSHMTALDEFEVEGIGVGLNDGGHRIEVPVVGFVGEACEDEPAPLCHREGSQRGEDVGVFGRGFK